VDGDKFINRLVKLQKWFLFYFFLKVYASNALDCINRYRKAFFFFFRESSVDSCQILSAFSYSLF